MTDAREPAPDSAEVVRLLAGIEALRRSEEELRRTFDNAPLGVGIVALDGRWLRVNRALCELLGYTAEELMLLSAQDVSHPEDLAGSLTMRNKLAGGEGSRVVMNRRYVRKDGETVHVVLHGSLVTDAGGSPLHYVTHMEDVTARKMLEAQAIVNDRMTSIGTLASGIAHEINNPLTSVVTSLELLDDHVTSLRPALPPASATEMAALVADARLGAERVRSIVRGLRTFSRIEEDRRDEIDLVAILDLAINMTLGDTRTRAKVARDYQALPPVHGDGARLSQVFINLLVNAAHAIPEGDIDGNAIKVSAFTDDKGRAVVEVRDTGAGMGPDVRARAFDPFFTTKPVGVSTGLGLTTCHAIVTQLGGEIWIESTGEQGTALRVALPATPPADASSRDPRASGGEGGGAPSREGRGESGPPRRGRVMVIDDDALAAKVVVRVLSREHEVIDVRSARDALERFRAGERFDLVVCDLMMPVMTGMDLLEEVERLGLDVADRMVFMTGGAFTERAQAFLARLPNRWFEKPFEATTLRTLARAYVR